MKIVGMLTDSTNSSIGDNFTMRVADSCCACGLLHEDVERSGIDFCPNPVCTISGAYWFREKCSTYKNTIHGSHVVDPNEMYEFGVWLLQADIGEFTEPVKKSLEFWQNLICDLNTTDVLER